jgi:hypothetical protein
MWVEKLKINPIELLLSCGNSALEYFTKRDLLDLNPGNITDLWQLPTVEKLLKIQNSDGSWRYKGKRAGEKLGENYELVETWRNLRVLIEMFGCDNRHLTVQRAAEYIFSCQTVEGDIRGILSNQYIPYYMGAIFELLIKAGYENDDRILKGMDWLLDMRQNDGGWIIPMNMFKMQEYYSLCQKDPIPPEKERPFSHMATGMVIRSFAAHPVLREIEPAIQAGRLLKSRFFQKDAYSSRQAVNYWFKFQFPYWWTNLLTVMDSLMRLGFSSDDADIQKGITWFVEHQDKDGLWRATYQKNNYQESDLWITYAVCRILKYFLNFN